MKSTNINETPPIRLIKFYAYWSAATIYIYLLLRFIYHGPERVGKLELIGIMAGATIGTIWSIITLIRAFLLARKGIFVDSRNRNSRWRLFWIVIEILIPFAVGYCFLLFVKANKADLQFSDALWSLILFVLFTYFFVSSIGYYFLEWHFGKKFFDKPDK